MLGLGRVNKRFSADWTHWVKSVSGGGLHDPNSAGSAGEMLGSCVCSAKDAGIELVAKHFETHRTACARLQPLELLKGRSADLSSGVESLNAS